MSTVRTLRKRRLDIFSARRIPPYCAVNGDAHNRASMKLKTFRQALTPAQLRRFVARAGTTENYLLQLLGGHKQPSSRLLIALRDASQKMFAEEPRQWLTVNELLEESEQAQAAKRERLKRKRLRA